MAERATGAESKPFQILANQSVEGVFRILSKTVRETGLILLFDGEADPGKRFEFKECAPEAPIEGGPLAGGFDSKLKPSSTDHDEHSQTGILTLGFQLRSLLPDPDDQWRWEFVAHDSGATVSDFHGVPRRLAA